MLRIGSWENSAWDFLNPSETWIEVLRSAKAVCFGTLAQRGETSRTTIQNPLCSTPKSCLKVCDINLRPPFYTSELIRESLRLADVIKPNDAELKLIAQMWDWPDVDIPTAAKKLMAEFSPRLLCVMRGAHGAWACDGQTEIDVPGKPIEVIDTVGAGDAFTAGLIHATLQGWPLDQWSNWPINSGDWSRHEAKPCPLDNEKFQD